ELKDEERVFGGHLTELVVPGLLAFIVGLLNESAPSPVYVRLRAHPDGVEEILLFLAGRFGEVTADLERGADSGNLILARSMTSHLIDLVLFRLYGLSAGDREKLEARD